jgi:hypothetical protein
VEYCKAAIDSAFDDIAKGALEKAIISSVRESMMEVVHDVVTDCATDAVSEFFYSGDGNKIIKEAIFKAMSNQIKL